LKVTEMPAAGWWEALWPSPATVLAAVGISSGMNVIDLCCGDGWFTLQIAKLAKRVGARASRKSRLFTRGTPVAGGDLGGSSFWKNAKTARRFNWRRMTTWPVESTPWTWKTDLAISRPIVVTVCMDSSSESWEP
jgi:hypothetical protein